MAADTKLESETDDGPVELTAAGESLFTQAFLRAIPSNTATLHLASFREVLGKAAESDIDMDTAKTDPRWPRFYGSPLLRAAVRWVGAGAVLHATLASGGADNTSFSSDGFPLAVLVGRLEKHLQKLIHDELERFWSEHKASRARRLKAHAVAVSPATSATDTPHRLDLEERDSSDDLHSPENLALQWTLLFAAGFAQVQSGRTVATIALLKNLFDVFRALRIPGEESCPFQVRGVDDWVYKYLHIAIFWSSVVSALHISSASQQPALVDVLEDFPTVPVPCSNAALQSVPLPSERELNGPVSAELAAAAPPFIARQYLGWIDPPLASETEMEQQRQFRSAVDSDTESESDETEQDATDSILHLCFGQIKEDNGLMLQHPPLAQLLQKVTDYTTWLNTVAKLSHLDVLVAGELRTRGKESPLAVKQLLEASGTPELAIAFLLGNPHVSEALRRRQVLRDAVARIERPLPEEVSTAMNKSDLEGLERIFQGKPRNALVQLVAVLTKLQQLAMLLCTPEPFKDMLVDDGDEEGEEGGEGEGKEGDPPIAGLGPKSAAGDGVSKPDSQETLIQPNSSSSTASSGRSHSRNSVSSASSNDSVTRSLEEGKLSIWFSSPSFAEASANAIILSATMRALSARVSPMELATNYVAAYFFCSAAVYAAWLSLLLLRRFRILASATAARTESGLLDLHAHLRNDAQACLDILSRAPLPQYTPLRVLLSSLLSGDATRLSPAHAQMLRMASKVIGRCPHSESIDDGECYLCVAAKMAAAANQLDSVSVSDAASGSGSTVGGGVTTAVMGDHASSVGVPETPVDELLSDPFADAVVGVRRKRRVRFADGDAVTKTWETWSEDDYQRGIYSGMRKDGKTVVVAEEVGKDGETVVVSVARAAPLQVQMSQRAGADGMLDLRKFW